jgi:hypothetical protein
MRAAGNRDESSLDHPAIHCRGTRMEWTPID